MDLLSFVDSAKVMAKGQITIPKDIRKILKLSVGDRVSFIVENNEVRIVNSAFFAMKRFQKEMEGEAVIAGLNNEKDVMEMIKEIREED